MEIIPIRTKAILPPQDDLLKKIKDASFELKESDCIAITSKVVSIWQGRCIPKNEADRDDLIKKEVILKELQHRAKRSTVVSAKKFRARRSGYPYS